MPTAYDLTGRSFGKLTAVRLAGEPALTVPMGKARKWLAAYRVERSKGA